MGLNDSEEEEEVGAAAAPAAASAATANDLPCFVLSDVGIDFAQVRVIDGYLDQVRDASVHFTTMSRFGADSYVLLSPSDGLPLKGRLWADCDFSAPSSSPVSLSPSAHASRVGVFKRAQKTNQKTIILKSVSDGRLAQLEAWFCACHQLLTPECVPKARVVYFQGQSVGIYSEILNDFKAIGDQAITYDLLTEHAGSLARIMISAYLLEEDDLHRFNFSLRHRIDFDGSFWSLMSSYKGKRFWTSPETAFGVDMEDIRHFPNIRRCDPFYWPTKHHLFKLTNDFTLQECDCFAKLEKNELFIHEKFKLLLKFILLKPEQFSRLALLHLNPNDFIQDFIVEKTKECLRNKQAQLKEILLKMLEFQNWLETSGARAFEEIKIENEKFNALYRHEKYKDQRINERDFEKAYSEIRHDASSILPAPCSASCS